MKKTKILIVSVMAIIMLFGVAGCRGDAPRVEIDQTENYSWSNDDGYLAASSKDSSDLPSWENQKLKLKLWNSLSLSGFTFAGDEDVVYPEIERVTGVTIDKDFIMDNAGSFPQKLSMVITSGEHPDIFVGGGATSDSILNLNNTLSGELVYNLKDLLPIYAPNLYARVNASVPHLLNRSYINGGINGDIYGVPYSVGNINLSDIYTELSPSQSINFNFSAEQYKYFLMRDDVLTAVYEAGYTEYFNCVPMTQAEIASTYVANGAFTETQLFDVNITSEAQFISFLRDVNTVINNSPAGEFMATTTAKIKTTHAASSSESDNWNLMQMLFAATQGRPSGVDQMFTYWNRESEEVRMMLLEDFFKDSLKFWYELTRDGVADPEALTLDMQTFNTKIANGEYAITYPYCNPNNASLTSQGKDFQYRKVYLHIPQADRFAYWTTAEAASCALYIFKKNIKEEDLPQILMWMDYQCSKIAEKMTAWGPRSAGLFNEVDGVRTFKNAELQQAMVDDYRLTNNIFTKLNLISGEASNPRLAIGFFHAGLSDQLACFTSASPNATRSANDANTAFSSYAVLGQAEKDLIKRMPTLWSWFPDVPELSTFWNARTNIELALKQILAASNDADFNTKYDAMVAAVVSAGFTEAVRAKLDAAFKATNDGLWQQVKTRNTNG